nr:MAG TPA: Translation initiation factor IF-2, N-terminal region [Bacteriophage sp.]
MQHTADRWSVFLVGLIETYQQLAKALGVDPAKIVEMED